MDITVNKIDALGQSKLAGIANKVENQNSGREEPPRIKLSREDVKGLVNTLNSAAKSVDSIDRRMSFHFNEKANRVIIKIVDSQSNEIVQEIPPKDMVRLLEGIHEFIGMLVDESR